MRTWLSVFFITALCLSCAKVELDDGGGNTPSGSNTLKFKNYGGYETVPLKNVSKADLTISNPVKGSSQQQLFEKEFAQKIVAQMNFNEPGTIKIEKMEQTGRLTINYLYDGSPLGQSRDFKIYNYRYLQDAHYTETVYSSAEMLTEAWMAEQKTK